MVAFGNEEKLFGSDGAIKSDLVDGGAKEVDPFAALDDFAPDEKESDDATIGVESAMGKEYQEEKVIDEDEVSADTVGNKDDKKPFVKQLTPEEIKKITEKNKREKKLSHKNIIAKKAKASKSKSSKKKKKKK